jgi:hypothetical protein
MDNGSLSHFLLPAAPTPALLRKSYSFVKGQRYAFVGYYHAVMLLSAGSVMTQFMLVSHCQRNHRNEVTGEPDDGKLCAVARTERIAT